MLARDFDSPDHLGPRRAANFDYIAGSDHGYVPFEEQIAMSLIGRRGGQPSSTSAPTRSTGMVDTPAAPHRSSRPICTPFRPEIQAIGLSG